MAEIITNFPELLELPVEGDPSFRPTGVTGFAKEFRGDIYSSRGRFGNGTNFWDIGAESMKTNNFVSGLSGVQITYAGRLEAEEGYFRGDITGATGTFTSGIAVGTSPNWFKVDSNGNIWSGNATLAGAQSNTFAVTNTGALYCTSATISGATITTPILTGIQSGSEIAIQGWTHDLVFSVTDADTVAWASGTITLMNDDTYSVDAGNTGNMAAETYIYLDIGTSITVLQKTTTKTTAIGSGKIMVAICENATGEAEFMVFSSSEANYDGAKIRTNSITANEIGANVITATEIFAGTITATEITGSTLSAIYADLGTITAGSISVVSGANTIGLTPGGANAIFSGTTGNPEFKVTPAGALTATSATITGGTITGGSIDIESAGTHYLTVDTAGVTVIRFHPSATSNFVTSSNVSMLMGGSPTSYFTPDEATTDITRLSITRNKTSGTVTSDLVIINDTSSTAGGFEANTVRITSAVKSTGVGLLITKTGNTPAVKITQGGDDDVMQFIQNGEGFGLRIDQDSTGALAAISTDNTNAGPGIQIGAWGNGAHLQLTGDPTVSSPADGEIWFDGTNLKMRKGATTYNINMTAV